MSVIDLKNQDLAENVFEKVDKLFSLIHTLPSNVQAASLAEIKQRLMHNVIKLPENAESFESEQSCSICTPDKFSEGSDESGSAESNSKLSLLSQHCPASLCQLQNSSSPLVLKKCEVKLKRIDAESACFEKSTYLQKDTTIQEQICQYSEDFQQREEENKGCNASSANRRRIKKLKQQNDLICSICSQSFHSQDSLKIHKRIHSGILLHKCDICEKQFSQKSSLGCHMRRHRAVKSFKCPMCKYSAVAKIDIERHIPTHTKQRNYICNICDKSYFTNVKLKDHINNVHNKMIREVCEICGFATHSKDIMRRHRIVKHTNQETFQCPICNIIIKQKGTFLIHMRIHTGERPYPCKECSKTFKSRSQLASHTRIHRDGEFVCKTCGHKFRSQSHLQRHTVIHTGAKPFSCHLCLYKCNVRANITKHVRSVHGLPQFTLKEVPSKPSLEATETTSALERGLNAAKECLEKFSAELGSEITVQELQQKENKSQTAAKASERQNTEQEICIDKAKETEIRDIIVSLPESCLSTACNSPSLSHVLSSNKEKPANNSRDILLDAMKLLTSVSTDDEEPILADSSFLHKRDQAVEIDSSTADNLYVCIIQVFSDETNSFQK